MFCIGNRQNDEEQGQEGESGISSPSYFFRSADCRVIKNCPKICHGQEDHPSHNTKKSVCLVPVGVAI
jgi:hypothetical protein